MQDIPRRLTLLETKLDELADDGEPMMVSQLEGYLAGIIVCPELIMPSEWLALIWDTESAGDGPIFQNARQAEKLMSLVMEHYNATIADIGAGRYAPVFDVDTRNDDVLWEMWIDGFEMAMSLRPKSWSVFLGTDEEATAAIAGLITLADIANGKSKLKKKDIDELQSAAPDLIPGWIEILNATRMAQHAGNMPRATAPTSTPKVGRNDPCPCGSGKKYKKCCGLN
jgi:uncharacterized protein